jgi:MoaA/NifB/PqqE/SkfB family radical SAM enzyme
MCDFWKDSAKISEGLTLSELDSLFEDLRAFGSRMVQFTGGEPFLRKDLIDILRNAKNKGLETVIVTNGTLINEDNVLGLANNIDLVYVSLDAPSESQHEHIRGVSGIFNKITKSVKLLTDILKENSLRTQVILCPTITPAGIHRPQEMVDLAKRLGARGIIYNPSSSVHYGNTILKGEHIKDDNYREVYSKMVDEILQLAADPKNIIRSNPFYLAASKEFILGREKYYKFSCFGGGYNGALIGFDGSVFPCCAWNMPLGNVKEEAFSKIWKSKRAKEARAKIKKRECPVCYHHTRTFDFIWRAPLLFKDPKMLMKGYGIIQRK